MGSLTETPFDGSLKSPEEMLALWRQVEVDIAETGQSYNAPGGVEVAFSDIEKVREQVNYWDKRVLARKGYTGRNTADVSPHGDTGGAPL